MTKLNLSQLSTSKLVGILTAWAQGDSERMFWITDKLITSALKFFDEPRLVEHGVGKSYAQFTETDVITCTVEVKPNYRYFKSKDRMGIELILKCESVQDELRLVYYSTQAASAYDVLASLIAEQYERTDVDDSGAKRKLALASYMDGLTKLSSSDYLASDYGYVSPLMLSYDGDTWIHPEVLQEVYHESSPITMCSTQWVRDVTKHVALMMVVKHLLDVLVLIAPEDWDDDWNYSLWDHFQLLEDLYKDHKAEIIATQWRQFKDSRHTDTMSVLRRSILTFLGNYDFPEETDWYHCNPCALSAALSQALAIELAYTICVTPAFSAYSDFIVLAGSELELSSAEALNLCSVLEGK